LHPGSNDGCHPGRLYTALTVTVHVYNAHLMAGITKATLIARCSVMTVDMRFSHEQELAIVNRLRI